MGKWLLLGLSSNNAKIDVSYAALKAPPSTTISVSYVSLNAPASTVISVSYAAVKMPTFVSTGPPVISLAHAALKGPVRPVGATYIYSGGSWHSVPTVQL